MTRPNVIAGECGTDTKNGKRLAGMGWGRMKLERRWDPYRGEPWAIDNHVFRQWNAARKAAGLEEGDFIRLGSPGVAYDGAEFLRQYEHALNMVENHHGAWTAPLFAVILDEVGDAERSLARSFAFLEELNYSRGTLLEDDGEWEHDAWGFAHGLRYSSIPLYLAVQDGMTPAMVEAAAYDSEMDRSFLDDVAGIFLGGSNAFKEETAALWREFATARGMKLHYARAGSVKKLRAAIAAGADSIDSAAFMWSYEKWSRLERAWLALDEGPEPDDTDWRAEQDARHLTPDAA